jgi:hypothetical protein
MDQYYNMAQGSSLHFGPIIYNIYNVYNVIAYFKARAQCIFGPIFVQ